MAARERGVAADNTDEIIASLQAGDDGDEPDGGDDQGDDDAPPDDDDEPDAAVPGASPAKGKRKPEKADDDDGSLPPPIAAARAAAKAKNFTEFFEMLGLEPSDLELDDKAWTAHRAAHARSVKRIKAEEQAAIGRLQGWQADLQAREAKLAEERSSLGKTAERVGPLQKCLESYESTGDPSHLVALVEKATGKPYDEAQKDILHKVRRSPGERRLEQTVEELRAQLDELKKGNQPAQQQPDPDAVLQKDLEIITTHVGQAVEQSLVHGDVTKVPHYARRIHAVLVRTRNPTTGRITQTVDQAARIVLKAERKRLANHPLARRAPADEPAPKPARTKQQPRQDRRAPRPDTRDDAARRDDAAPLLRRDSRAGGTRVRRPEDDDETIIQELIRRDGRGAPR